LLLPWSDTGDSLQRAVLRWLEEEGLTGRLLAAAAEMGTVTEDVEEALDAVTVGVLSMEQGEWRISLDGADANGEVRRVVAPNDAAEVVVNLAAPLRDGRVCYAIRVVDDEGDETLSTIVAVESTGTEWMVDAGWPES
jgi:hypothetical protein